LVEQMRAMAEQDKAEVVLMGAETAAPWEYGVLRMENNKVMEIVENPAKGQEPSNIKLVGSLLLPPDFFDYYQKLGNYHPEDFIDALNLCIKDKATGLIVLEKERSVLKYPWHLLGMVALAFESEEFKPFLSATAKIGKNVVMEGDVFIGKDVVIGNNTVIKGPCYIGDNCKIGASNVLRGPVDLENNVLTGALMEIKNSLIQEGTHLHSGYVGDSVIGRNCRFGAGFVTANRRIDRVNIKADVKGNKIDTSLTYLGAMIGDNVRFGIHCGTMPGVLIGKDCLVGPGTIVFENLEDNANLYTKFENIKKGV